MIPQSLQFILFCVQKMILYQTVARISERLFLLMTLCTSFMRRTSWPMKILVVVLLSTRSCEKPKCIPNNDQHNCFINEQHKSNIFLNPYNLWDIVPAALMSLNHTNDRYSMSIQYPQPTTRQPRTDSYPVFSSLRRMYSKRKGLRVRFAFFQWNYLPDGRVNETVATVEELSDLCKPGAKDGIPPFVMNCNCM